jgi:hypothetical protein
LSPVIRHSYGKMRETGDRPDMFGSNLPTPSPNPPPSGIGAGPISRSHWSNISRFSILRFRVVVISDLLSDLSPNSRGKGFGDRSDVHLIAGTPCRDFPITELSPVDCCEFLGQIRWGQVQYQKRDGPKGANIGSSGAVQMSAGTLGPWAQDLDRAGYT